MMMESPPCSAGISRPPLTAVTVTVPYGSSFATAAVSTEVWHTNRDIHEHVLGGFAKHPEEAKAGVANGVGDRAPGGLGGILAMDVNAHAHLGDTAHACHRVLAFVRVRENIVAPIYKPAKK